jgi:hypothetical protein
MSDGTREDRQDANLPIRAYKRHLAVAALGLLLLGTITAGIAKAVYLAQWHLK